MVHSCLKSKTHAVERSPWPYLVTVQQPRIAPEGLAAAKLRLMPSFSPLGSSGEKRPGKTYGNPFVTQILRQPEREVSD